MNTYTVDILQKVKVKGSIVAALRTAVDETLRHERMKPPASVTLLLTGDEQLQELNHTFRGIDAPTDVLSFPAETSPVVAADAENRYLGDIAISVSMAERQAREGGHSLLDELMLLTVHGTLHLLGYDHEERAQQQVMWAAQDSILAQLGAEITSPEW